MEVDVILEICLRGLVVGLLMLVLILEVRVLD